MQRWITLSSITLLSRELVKLPEWLNLLRKINGSRFYRSLGLRARLLAGTCSVLLARRAARGLQIPLNWILHFTYPDFQASNSWRLAVLHVPILTLITFTLSYEVSFYQDRLKLPLEMNILEKLRAWVALEAGGMAGLVWGAGISISSFSHPSFLSFPLRKVCRLCTLTSAS